MYELHLPMVPGQGDGMTISVEPQHGFWCELAEPERVALRAICDWRRFERNSAIVAEDDAVDDIVIIWSGLAKVRSRGTSRPVLLALRGPGDIVGEMASIGGGGRSATVIAINEVVGLVVNADRFGEFLSKSPDASKAMQRVLVARLRESDSSRIRAAATNVAQRLARLLLDIGQRYGVPADGGSKIDLALTQEDLAAFINASPRAVAREIERWKDRDIVTAGRRWVTIQQPTALRRIARIGALPQVAADRSRA
jgi:CRP/FNR family cyclic AMP-dependent transcriptional regulator